MTCHYGGVKFKMETWLFLVLSCTLAVSSLEVVVEQRRLSSPSYDDILSTGFQCTGRDSCQGYYESNHTSVTWTRRNCFCDDLCAMYGDCCIDARAYVKEEQATNHMNFGCVNLKQYGDLYMRHKCLLDNSNGTASQAVRSGCEDGAGPDADPFGSMPVTSAVTGITYKNYYCAVCNRDSEKIKFWNPRVECQLHGYSLTSMKYDNASIADQLAWSVRHRKWGLWMPRSGHQAAASVGGGGGGGSSTFHECSIDPVVPTSGDVTLRPCTGKRIVSDCPAPPAGGAATADLCGSYTALVFEPTNSYRNVHCALCNNASLENLICLNTADLQRSTYRSMFNPRAFSVLFDIGGDQGDLVGYVSAAKVCRQGVELYDPFFKKCRNVVCGDGLAYVSGKCVKKDQEISTVPSVVTEPTVTVVTKSTAVTEPTVLKNNVTEQSATEQNVTNQSAAIQNATEQSTLPIKKTVTTSETVTLPSESVTTASDVVTSTTEAAVAPAPEELYFDRCPKFVLAPGEFTRVNETAAVVGDAVLTHFRPRDDGSLVVCAVTADVAPKFDEAMSTVTLVCLGVSVVCLSVHVVATACVPELHNLSGKNLLSLSVALLGGYCSFIATMFVDRSDHGSVACVVLAVFMYFFFMSSFFWMLVIAFDVWRTLKAATTQLRLTAGKQWKKFGVYSLVGWVAPLTLTTLVVVVEHLKDTVPDEYRPGFADGHDLCWFSSKKALLVYFAVPFAGIMSANAALFVASSLVIFDSTKNKVGASCSGGGGQTKTNFWLYLKLAVVMGIGWSLGLAAGFANHVTGLWYAFIACNTLQVWRGAREAWSASEVTLKRTRATASTDRSQRHLEVAAAAGGDTSSSSSHPQGVDAITEASPRVVPSRYGPRGQTMYTVSRQQASSLTQHSFDGRFI